MFNVAVAVAVNAHAHDDDHDHAHVNAHVRPYIAAAYVFGTSRRNTVRSVARGLTFAWFSMSPTNPRW